MTRPNCASTLLFNSPATGVRNLWMLLLSGEASARQITFLPRGLVSYSALSPDGSQVAYVSVETSSGQIWIANPDGSGVRQLTNNQATNFWPFWSAGWQMGGIHLDASRSG
jgi:TolB protein